MDGITYLQHCKILKFPFSDGRYAGDEIDSQPYFDQIWGIQMMKLFYGCYFIFSEFKNRKEGEPNILDVPQDVWLWVVG